MRVQRGLLLLALTLVAVAGSVPRGHTPISSRWNYNEHLFPIFRDRCGACHIEGGVAPMSLVDYQAAYPWTQSIREEILGLRMPPWQAEDGFGDFKNGHALPAHEMDMILEWSSGELAPDPTPFEHLGDGDAVLSQGRIIDQLLARSDHPHLAVDLPRLALGDLAATLT